MDGGKPLNRRVDRVCEFDAAEMEIIAKNGHHVPFFISSVIARTVLRCGFSVWDRNVEPVNGVQRGS